MILAGIKVTDTRLVREAMDLARSSSEPYLFNHVMRSWLFSDFAFRRRQTFAGPRAPGRFHCFARSGSDRPVHGRGAVRGRWRQRSPRVSEGARYRDAATQLVWDAIALHTTRSIALHKEPEVAMTHSGIAVDAIGVGLDRIPHG